MLANAVNSVDVIVLHRPGDSPRKEILQAIRQQRGVNVTLHLQVGAPEPGDAHRRVTIARARNKARRLGVLPWVMFVDDDVLLHPDCIASLLAELNQSPELGAVAADYLNQHRPGDTAGHVAMGATLFRRSVLERLNFRYSERLCECWCACLDLRSNQVEIRYCPAAQARHVRIGVAESAVHGQSADHQNQQHPNPQTSPTSPEPLVLAAFDRRDVDRFEYQFLKTLRAHRNPQRVIAVGYGLYPTERRQVERLEQVQLDWQSYNGMMVPVRRIADFARILESVAPQTPVAYWDVADVVFQDSLDDLWQAVRSTPDRLLAVIEPKSYPHNGVIPAWSLSIRDPHHRRQAFELLKTNPFLNSGFAAGTAATMLKYFRAAVAMRHGPELTGTTDWGDQMCLNMYCHKDPQRWRPVDPRWNYCVHDRPTGEVRVTPHGRIESRSGARISIAHGNARSLRQFAILQRD